MKMYLINRKMYGIELQVLHLFTEGFEEGWYQVPSKKTPEGIQLYRDCFNTMPWTERKAVIDEIKEKKIEGQPVTSTTDTCCFGVFESDELNKITDNDASITSSVPLITVAQSIERGIDAIGDLITFRRITKFLIISTAWGGVIHKLDKPTTLTVIEVGRRESDGQIRYQLDYYG